MQSLPETRGLPFLPLGTGTGPETQGKGVWRVSGRKSSEVPGDSVRARPFFLQPGGHPEEEAGLSWGEAGLGRRRDSVSRTPRPGFPPTSHSFIHLRPTVTALLPFPLPYSSTLLLGPTPFPHSHSPGVDCLVGRWPMNRYDGESV